MSEIQPPQLRDGGIIAFNAAAYGLGGAVVGMGVGEVGVIPIGFPKEHEQWMERNDQKRDVKDQLSDDEVLLRQLQDPSSHGFIDYTALEKRIAAHETQLETLENSHIPYDDIHLPVVGISAGAGLIIGAAFGAVRCKLQLRKQDQERAKRGEVL